VQHYRKAQKKLKITKEPYKYAKRTRYLFQNAIRSPVFLLQDSDEPLSMDVAPALGTTPLGPGQQEKAETEQAKQREAVALQP
jgi:hypothetical protein